MSTNPEATYDISVDYNALNDGIVAIKDIKEKCSQLISDLSGVDVSILESAGLMTDSINIVENVMDGSVDLVLSRIMEVETLLYQFQNEDFFVDLQGLIENGYFNDEMGDLDCDAVIDYMIQNAGEEFKEALLDSEFREYFITQSLLSLYGFSSFDEMDDKRNELVNTIQNYEAEKTKLLYNSPQLIQRFIEGIITDYNGICTDFDGVASKTIMAYCYTDSNGVEKYVSSFDDVPSVYQSDVQALSFTDLCGDSELYSQLKGYIDDNYAFLNGSYEWENFSESLNSELQENETKLAEVDSLLSKCINIVGSLDYIKDDIPTRAAHLSNNVYEYIFNEDFEENCINSDADAVSSVIQDFKNIYLEGNTYTLSDKELENAIVYSLISGTDDFKTSDGVVYFYRESGDMISIFSDDYFVSSVSQWVDVMSDNEKNVFYYKWNTDGADSAYQYVKDMSDVLDERWVLKQTQIDQEYASAHPVKATVASILSNPIEGFKAFTYSTTSISSGNDMNGTQLYASGDTMRQQVGTDIGEKYGSGAAFTYNVGMSISDNIMSMALTGGSPTGSGLVLAASSWDDNMNDARSRGVTDGQAYMETFTKAAIEAATEAANIDKLINLKPDITLSSVAKISDPTVRRIATWGANTAVGGLKQGISEGSEEVISSILGRQAEEVISGPNSSYNLSVNRYLGLGYSEEDAIAMANQEFNDEVKESFLSGFASGEVMGSTQITGGVIANDINAKSIVREYYNSSNQDNFKQVSDSMRDGNYGDAVLQIMSDSSIDISERTNAASNIINALSDKGMIKAEAASSLQQETNKYNALSKLFARSNDGGVASVFGQRESAVVAAKKATTTATSDNIASQGKSTTEQVVTAAKTIVNEQVSGVSQNKGTLSQDGSISTQNKLAVSAQSTQSIQSAQSTQSNLSPVTSAETFISSSSNNQKTGSLENGDTGLSTATMGLTAMGVSIPGLASTMTGIQTNTSLDTDSSSGSGKLYSDERIVIKDDSREVYQQHERTFAGREVSQAELLTESSRKNIVDSDSQLTDSVNTGNDVVTGVANDFFKMIEDGIATNELYVKIPYETLNKINQLNVDQTADLIRKVINKGYSVDLILDTMSSSKFAGVIKNFINSPDGSTILSNTSATFIFKVVNNFSTDLDFMKSYFACVDNNTLGSVLRISYNIYDKSEIESLIGIISDTRFDSMIRDGSLTYNENLPSNLKNSFFDSIRNIEIEFGKTSENGKYGAEQSVLINARSFVVKGVWTTDLKSLTDFIESEYKKHGWSRSRARNLAVSMMTPGTKISGREFNLLTKYVASNPKYSFRDILNLKFKRVQTETYTRILNKYEAMGIDRKTATKIIDCIDTTGICSYADVANLIIDKYKNNLEGFKNDFGFDLYIEIDGKKVINDAELLADMYITINSNLCGGSLFKYNNGKFEVNGNTIDTSKQQYMSGYTHNVDIINKYFGCKNLELQFKCSDSIISTIDSPLNIDIVKEKVINGIKSGKQVSLVFCTTEQNSFHLYDNNGNLHTDTGTWRGVSGYDAHAVYVTGITDTDLIVSSWGQRFTIPLTDFNNNKYGISISEISRTEVNYDTLVSEVFESVDAFQNGFGEQTGFTGDLVSKIKYLKADVLVDIIQKYDDSAGVLSQVISNSSVAELDVAIMKLINDGKTEVLLSKFEALTTITFSTLSKYVSDSTYTAFVDSVLVSNPSHTRLISTLSDSGIIEMFNKYSDNSKMITHLFNNLSTSQYTAIYNEYFSNGFTSNFISETLENAFVGLSNKDAGNLLESIYNTNNSDAIDFANDIINEFGIERINEMIKDGTLSYNSHFTPLLRKHIHKQINNPGDVFLKKLGGQYGVDQNAVGRNIRYSISKPWVADLKDFANYMKDNYKYDSLTAYFEAVRLNTPFFHIDSGDVRIINKYLASKDGTGIKETLDLERDILKRTGNNYYRQLHAEFSSKCVDSSTAARIMGCIDNTGACSYAAFANVIANSYKNNPAGFKADFGFDLYIDVNGKQQINSQQLMLDMYVFMNSVENGGRLFKTVDGKIGLVGKTIDTDKQKYVSARTTYNDCAFKYLKSKNSKLTLIYSQTIDATNMSKAELRNAVVRALQSGYQLDMFVGRNLEHVISFNNRFGTEQSTVTWSEGDAHSVYVTGITDSSIIVSSWGKRYTISFDSLANNPSAAFIVCKLDNMSGAINTAVATSNVIDMNTVVDGVYDTESVIETKLSENSSSISFDTSNLDAKGVADLLTSVEFDDNYDAKINSIFDTLSGDKLVDVVKYLVDNNILDCDLVGAINDDSMVNVLNILYDEAPSYIGQFVENVPGRMGSVIETMFTQNSDVNYDLISNILNDRNSYYLSSVVNSSPSLKANLDKMPTINDIYNNYKQNTFVKFNVAGMSITLNLVTIDKVNAVIEAVNNNDLVAVENTLKNGDLDTESLVVVLHKLDFDGKINKILSSLESDKLLSVVKYMVDNDMADCDSIGAIDSDILVKILDNLYDNSREYFDKVIEPIPGKMSEVVELLFKDGNDHNLELIDAILDGTDGFSLSLIVPNSPSLKANLSKFASANNVYLDYMQNNFSSYSIGDTRLSVNLLTMDKINTFVQNVINSDSSISIDTLLSDSSFNGDAFTILLDKLSENPKGYAVITDIISKLDTNQLFEMLNKVVANKGDFVRVIDTLSTEQFVSFVEQLNDASVKNFLETVSVDKIVSVYDNLGLSGRMQLDQKIGNYVDMIDLCIYKQKINDGSMDAYIKGLSDVEFNEFIEDVLKNEIHGIADLVDTIVNYDITRVNQMIADGTLKYNEKLPAAIKKSIMEVVLQRERAFEKYANAVTNTSSGVTGYTTFGIDQDVTRKHVKFTVENNAWMKNIEHFAEFILNDSKQNTPDSTMTKERALALAEYLSTANSKLIYSHYDIITRYLANNYSEKETIRFARESFTRENSAEYKRVLDKLIPYTKDVVTATKILDCINSTGICSYASVANIIFDYYKDMPAQFKQDFGFDLYVEIDGELRINEIELLTDMYITINGNQMNGNLFRRGGLFGKGKLQTFTNLNTKLQTYLSNADVGVKVDILNKYLSLKKSSLAFDKELVSCKGKTIGEVSASEIKKMLITGLQKGDYIDLGIYKTNKKITLRNPDGSIYTSTFDWKEGVGHAVYVVGVTNDSVVVSSWGMKLLIPFGDLVDNMFTVSFLSKTNTPATVQNTAYIKSLNTNNSTIEATVSVDGSNYAVSSNVSFKDKIAEKYYDTVLNGLTKSINKQTVDGEVSYSYVSGMMDKKVGTYLKTLTSGNKIYEVMSRLSNNQMLFYAVNNCDLSLLSDSQLEEIINRAVRSGYVLNEQSSSFMKNNSNVIMRLLKPDSYYFREKSVYGESSYDKQLRKQQRRDAFIDFVNNINYDVLSSEQITEVIDAAAKNGYYISDKSPSYITGNIEVISKLFGNLDEKFHFNQTVNNINYSLLSDSDLLVIADLIGKSNFGITDSCPSILRCNPDVISQIIKGTPDGRSINAKISAVSFNSFSDQQFLDTMKLALDKGYVLDVHSPIERLNVLFENEVTVYLETVNSDYKGMLESVIDNLGYSSLAIEGYNGIFSEEMLRTFGTDFVIDIFKYCNLTGSKFDFEGLIRDGQIETFKQVFDRTLGSEYKGTFNDIKYVKKIIDKCINNSKLFEEVLNSSLDNSVVSNLRKYINSNFGIEVHSLSELQQYDSLVKDYVDSVIASGNIFDIQRSISLLLFNATDGGMYDFNQEFGGVKNLDTLASKLNDSELASVLKGYSVLLKFYQNKVASNKNVKTLSSICEKLNNMSYDDRTSYLKVFDDIEGFVKYCYGMEVNQSLTSIESIVGLDGINTRVDGKYTWQDGSNFTSVDYVEINSNYRLFQHTLNAYGTGGKITDYQSSRVVGKTYLCLSMIGDNKIGVIRETSDVDHVTLLFDSVVPQDLMACAPRDIGSGLWTESNDFFINDRGSRFDIVDNILSNTDSNGYNEYVVYRNNAKPSGILVTGVEANSAEIEAAARLGVPLVKINYSGNESIKVNNNSQVTTDYAQAMNELVGYMTGKNDYTVARNSHSGQIIYDGARSGNTTIDVSQDVEYELMEGESLGSRIGTQFFAESKAKSGANTSVVDRNSEVADSKISMDFLEEIRSISLNFNLNDLIRSLQRDEFKKQLSESTIKNIKNLSDIDTVLSLIDTVISNNSPLKREILLHIDDISVQKSLSMDKFENWLKFDFHHSFSDTLVFIEEANPKLAEILREAFDNIKKGVYSNFIEVCGKYDFNGDISKKYKNDIFDVSIVEKMILDGHFIEQLNLLGDQEFIALVNDFFKVRNFEIINALLKSRDNVCELINTGGILYSNSLDGEFVSLFYENINSKHDANLLSESVSNGKYNYGPNQGFTKERPNFTIINSLFSDVNDFAQYLVSEKNMSYDVALEIAEKLNTPGKNCDLGAYVACIKYLDYKGYSDSQILDMMSNCMPISYGQEYYRLFDKMIDKGYNHRDAKMILDCVDTRGVCSYATIANIIMEEYISKFGSSRFKQDFGFDLYVEDNGRIRRNGNELLFDMYMYVNSDLCGGSLFKFNDGKFDIVGDKLDLSGRYINTGFQQNVIGSNVEVALLNKYLKAKGINIELDVNFRFFSFDSLNVNGVREVFYNLLNSNNQVALTLENGHFKYILADGIISEDNYYDEGHAVYVTGMNENGVFVSTWGGRALISFDSFIGSESTASLCELVDKTDNASVGDSQLFEMTDNVKNEVRISISKNVDFAGKGILGISKNSMLEMKLASASRSSIDSMIRDGKLTEYLNSLTSSEIYNGPLAAHVYQFANKMDLDAMGDSFVLLTREQVGQVDNFMDSIDDDLSQGFALSQESVDTMDSMSSEELVVVVDKLLSDSEYYESAKQVIKFIDDSVLGEVFDRIMVRNDSKVIASYLEADQVVALMDYYSNDSVSYDKFCRNVSYAKFSKVAKVLNEMSAKGNLDAMRMRSKLDRNIDSKFVSDIRNKQKSGTLSTYLNNLSDNKVGQLFEKMIEQKMANAATICDSMIEIIGRDRFSAMIRNGDIKFDTKYSRETQKSILDIINQQRDGSLKELSVYGVDQGYIRSHIKYEVKYNWSDDISDISRYLSKKYGLGMFEAEAKALNLTSPTYRMNYEEHQMVIDYLSSKYGESEALRMASKMFERKVDSRYMAALNKLVSHGTNIKTAQAILECIDTTGVCSYASVANLIVDVYKDNPSQFKKDFGFDLYTYENGHKEINSTELLADMYVYINSNLCGGKLFTITNGKVTTNTTVINTEKQTFLSSNQGFESSLVNKYLHSKNPNVSVNVTSASQFYADGVNSEIDNIKTAIVRAIQEGKQVTLGVYRTKGSEYKFLDENGVKRESTVDWSEGDGHAVYVTGVTDNGVVVSTWGKRRIIPFSDFINNEYSINFVEMAIDGSVKANGNSPVSIYSNPDTAVHDGKSVVMDGSNISANSARPKFSEVQQKVRKAQILFDLESFLLNGENEGVCIITPQQTIMVSTKGANGVTLNDIYASLYGESDLSYTGYDFVEKGCIVVNLSSYGNREVLCPDSIMTKQCEELEKLNEKIKSICDNNSKFDSEPLTLYMVDDDYLFGDNNMDKIVEKVRCKIDDTIDVYDDINLSLNDSWRDFIRKLNVYEFANKKVERDSLGNYMYMGDLVAFSNNDSTSVLQMSKYFCGDVDGKYMEFGCKLNQMFLSGKTADEICTELTGQEQENFDYYLNNTIEGKFLSQLTSKEMESLLYYTSAAGNYIKINDALRRLKLRNDISLLSDDVRRLVERLDSIIQKFGGLTQDMVLYRGVGISPFSSIYKEVFSGLTKYSDIDLIYASLSALVGKEIYDFAYLSTSPGYSTSFASNDAYPVVLQIIAPKGTKGAYINRVSTHYNQENEFLLSRNTRLEIVEVIEPKRYVTDAKKIIVKCIIK